MNIQIIDDVLKHERDEAAAMGLNAHMRIGDYLKTPIHQRPIIYAWLMGTMMKVEYISSSFDLVTGIYPFQSTWMSHGDTQLWYKAWRGL